jgi:hypothetical protein
MRAEVHRSAFPSARIVAVAECGTHAMFDAVIGPYRNSEITLAGDLIDRLQPDMLLLADRFFYNFDLWNRAAATGADLLWRLRMWINPRFISTLADGSRLAEIRLDNTRTTGPATIVRVIDYTVNPDLDVAGNSEGDSEGYRLFTTILDPDVATATELAAAYAQRWEIESAFDELKTHQRGPRRVLRSKSPELVEQEIWGHLCCHYAIRTLMADTAVHSGHDPDRISFVKALHASRRSVAHQGDFPP